MRSWKQVTKERNKTMSVFPKLRVFLYSFIVGTIAGQTALAQDRAQGRSMVISRNGIVAAESPLAAQAGAKILERGGNAVDAAIATNAMMGVVGALVNGIGGGLFWGFFCVEAKKANGLRWGGGGPKGW